MAKRFTEHIQVSMAPDLDMTVRTLGARYNTSSAEVIRRAIEAGLKSAEKTLESIFGEPVLSMAEAREKALRDKHEDGALRRSRALRGAGRAQ